MDGLRQWALCIIIAAASGTLVCAFAPKGSADKTVRSIVGIFVVAVICAPLTQLDVDKIAFPVLAQPSNAEIDKTEMSEYMISVCKSAVENEIALSAAEFGVRVEYIGVDAYIDDDSCIIIQSVQIKIRSDKQESLSVFSSAVEKKLGMPVMVNAE